MNNVSSMEVVFDIGDGSKKDIDYTVADNAIRFYYDNIGCDIEIVANEVISKLTVELSTEEYQSAKHGSTDYGLSVIFNRSGRVDYTSSYFFNTLDLIKYGILSLKVWYNGNDFRSECNINMIEDCYSLCDATYLSRSNIFMSWGTLGKLLKCYDFSSIDYTVAGNSLIIEASRNYLIVSDYFFLSTCYLAHKDTFTCYRCEEDGFEYYMFVADSSNLSKTVQHRVVVKDGNIVYSTVRLTVVNKRLM